MTSSYYHLRRSTNAVYNVKMHIITVSIKIKLLMILKEGFVNRIREKIKKKDSQIDNNFF